MKRITDLKTRRGRVQGISQDAYVEEAVRKLLDTDVNGLVVYDGKKRRRGATLRHRGISTNEHVGEG